MKCKICGKDEESVSLFDGIGKNGFMKVCFKCSSREGIALVKKPNPEQLAEAERRRSVREVMEKMSLSKPHENNSRIIHKNLAKLNIPITKQEHGDLVENYDWILKHARRKAKMTTTKISELAGVDKTQYESLESGKLFSGFQSVAAMAEGVLDVRILKIPKNELKLIPAIHKKVEDKKNIERDILESVKQKMKRHRFLVKKSEENGIDYYEEEIETEHDKIDIDEIVRKKIDEKLIKQKKIDEELESEKFDFSRKENLESITIQDLSELKKLKQKRKDLE